MTQTSKQNQDLSGEENTRDKGEPPGKLIVVV